MVKICNRCRLERPLSAFHKHTKAQDGHDNRCKDCKALDRAKHYNKHRDEIRKQGRERYKQNKAAICKRTSILSTIRKLKISKEQYFELHKIGKCEICQTTDCGPRNFNIDHSHTTGKIRGLLCERCNRGLGFFQDNSQLLLDAANYLRDRDGK